MAFELNASYIETFETAFTPFLKQGGSRLMAATNQIEIVGETKTIRQRDVGPAYWSDSNSSVTKYATVRYDTRVLEPRRFDCTVELRDEDLIRQGLPDPGELAEQCSDSMGIFLDEIILNALGGAARTKTKSVALPATQVIAADFYDFSETGTAVTTPNISQVGLNTGKLTAAVKNIRAGHARGPMICTGSEHAMATLRADPRCANSLFNTQQSLATGMNNPYAGISAFIPVESDKTVKKDVRSLTNPAKYYRGSIVEYAYVYAMDHVKLGYSKQIGIKDFINGERNGNRVLQCWGMYDCVRIFETAVVQIEVVRTLGTLDA